MATVTLGSIKFNWKGAYNSSTAYAVDDVVSSGGNSYVCIQAHTNQAVGNATAYWNIMSSAGTNGTNGTDVGTTITTQGDLLYRDGSGLQRLAKPASDKFLQNTSGGVLSWETVSSPVLKVETFFSNTRVALSGTSYQTAMSGNYTKLSASSKVIVFVQYSQYGESNGAGDAKFTFGSSNTIQGTFYGKTNHLSQVATNFYFASNTQTGSLAWSLDFANYGGSTFNPNTNDDSRLNDGQGSTITIIEYT